MPISYIFYFLFFCLCPFCCVFKGQWCLWGQRNHSVHAQDFINKQKMKLWKSPLLQLTCRHLNYSSIESPQNSMYSQEIDFTRNTIEKKKPTSTKIDVLQLNIDKNDIPITVGRLSLSEICFCGCFLDVVVDGTEVKSN